MTVVGFHASHEQIHPAQVHAAQIRSRQVGAVRQEDRARLLGIKPLWPLRFTIVECPGQARAGEFSLGQ